jgi:hypothetical protein
MSNALFWGACGLDGDLPRGLAVIGEVSEEPEGGAKSITGDKGVDGDANDEGVEEELNDGLGYCKVHSAGGC